MSESPAIKDRVQEFWEGASCGEVYAQGDLLPDRLEHQARTRYELEPYIRDFAHFAGGAGRDVLEIGVGMGADHLEWARAQPRSLAGIDFTRRAIAFTRRRLEAQGLTSDLRVADAEDLPWADDSFDIVYAWGVIHHSPDTPRAVGEILRVLRPGGEAKVMIYHASSMIGYMLWLRYGLLAGRPARRLREIYAHHLESPGTKAYSVAEARGLFAGFSRVEIRPQLGPGDLLEGGVGQRHRGALLSIARALYPRWLVRRFLPNHGLYLLIRATK
jgi:SAM-dependent methyltransferase